MDDDMRYFIRALLNKLDASDAKARTDVLGRSELVHILEEMMRELKVAGPTDYARPHSSEEWKP